MILSKYHKRKLSSSRVSTIQQAILDDYSAT